MGDKDKSKKTSGQGPTKPRPARRYRCPFCEEPALFMSPQALNMHIKFKHKDEAASSEAVKAELAGGAVAEAQEPKQTEEESPQPEIKETVEELHVEEEPPMEKEPALDVVALLAQSGISVEVIDSLLQETPSMSAIVKALGSLEQQLKDSLSVMYAMSEEMKPVRDLYNQFKDKIPGLAAVTKPNTESTTLSPEEEQHLAAEQLKAMVGQPGEDGARQGAIERYFKIFLEAVKAMKEEPPQVSPGAQFQNQFIESLKLYREINKDSREEVLGGIKSTVEFFKSILKPGSILPDTESPAPHTATVKETE